MRQCRESRKSYLLPSSRSIRCRAVRRQPWARLLRAYLDSESEFVPSETDIRKKWPIQYFNRTCKCNGNYGGFDCGECSFGYNDGGACETKTVLPRVSVGAMDTNDWTDYRAALRAVKDTPSRYMVAKSDFHRGYTSTE
ncbi:Tyrosinase (Fragment) [Geodia barretti]|uniref:Tyrosinase n=1 Tax=Geodia barretti TaxID=519541 RepID=A0AA35WPT9_GEOBA